MKPKNLISVYQGAAALDSIELPVDQKFKALKKHEIRNLNSFCDIMQGLGCTFCDFDGYYVGYSIGQIGKEFDLLRFGDELVINIELKSELKVANKEEKILKQMRINHYYLKFLSRKIQRNILQFPALTLCNSANGGKALIFRRFRHLPFRRVLRISRRIPAWLCAET